MDDKKDGATETTKAPLRLTVTRIEAVRAADARLFGNALVKALGERLDQGVPRELGDAIDAYRDAITAAYGGNEVETEERNDPEVARLALETAIIVALSTMTDAEVASRALAFVAGIDPNQLRDASVSLAVATADKVDPGDRLVPADAAPRLSVVRASASGLVGPNGRPIGRG